MRTILAKQTGCRGRGLRRARSSCLRRRRIGAIRAAELRCHSAWRRLFGEANGAPSLEQMRARIARYRHLSYQLRVSPRLCTDFGNGEQYYAQQGRVIDLPERRADRPEREFLEWHLEEVFKAS